MSAQNAPSGGANANSPLLSTYPDPLVAPINGESIEVTFDRPEDSAVDSIDLVDRTESSAQDNTVAGNDTADSNHNDHLDNSDINSARVIIDLDKNGDVITPNGEDNSKTNGDSRGTVAKESTVELQPAHEARMVDALSPSHTPPQPATQTINIRETTARDQMQIDSDEARPPTDALANDREKTLDPNEFQIGWAGKDALKDSFDRRAGDREETITFIERFQKARALDVKCVNPLLRLMEISGLSRNVIAKDVLLIMLENLKAKIKSLTQDELRKLLDRSFSYLTVPVLQPIAVAVLENLTYVDPLLWDQIIENGLQESPYIDLPLTLRRRIWESPAGKDAFDFELEEFLKKLPDAAGPRSLDELAQSQLDREHLPVSSFATELTKMTKDLSHVLIVRVIQAMVLRARDETGLKRQAIANLFHQFLLTVKTKGSANNLTALRGMAQFLYHNTIDESHVENLREIRNALEVPASCPDMALLMSSSFSRDLISNHLVLSLLSRRGKVSNFEDSTLVSTATDHVKSDPLIPDLTYLCMANVNASSLLGGELLTTTAFDQPFQLFYPLIINEMHLDVNLAQDRYYQNNAPLPNDRFLELVSFDPFVRRILTTYCLQLCTQGMVVGYSRFRLLLDACLKVLDAKEEVREAFIGYNVIVKVLES